MVKTRVCLEKWIVEVYQSRGHDIGILNVADVFGEVLRAQDSEFLTRTECFDSLPAVLSFLMLIGAVSWKDVILNAGADDRRQLHGPQAKRPHSTVVNRK